MKKGLSEMQKTSFDKFENNEKNISLMVRRGTPGGALDM